MDCRWFNIHHCRSCELLSNPYLETLSLKEAELIALFPNQELNLQKTMGVDVVPGSRSKAKLAVYGSNEQIQFGFYDGQAKFSDLEECPLHMEGLNEILPVLKKKLLEFKIIPYSVSEKKGELKYVIISKSQSHNELLVRFVIRSKESLDRLRKMAAELVAEIPSVKVITANLQPEHKAVMEGAEEIILTAPQHIIHKFGDVSLTLGSRSFFQVTPEIAHKLYETVGEIVAREKIKSFLDLFCGVGAFSYFAARSCPEVYGVEISKEAINCAMASKELNHISGSLDFKALDVEAHLKNLGKTYEAVLVNPPRRGLNSSIVKDILAQKPKFIIYSSCNAETLARDVSEMAHEYSIGQSQIFDMFPFTAHFETLMVLRRRDA